jgi:hypothetical protein
VPSALPNQQICTLDHLLKRGGALSRCRCSLLAYRRTSIPAYHDDFEFCIRSNKRSGISSYIYILYIIILYIIYKYKSK